MHRALRGAVMAIAVALLGLTVWGLCGLTRHLIVAIDKFGDAGAAMTQTAAKLNGPHGTIAMLDEDIGSAKSMIVHADLVARHEQQQLSTWDERGTVAFDNLNGAVTDLRSTLAAAKGTINAATGTANAATAALGEGQRTIAAAQPLLGQTTATVAGFRGMQPDIARIAKASAETMEHADGIASDTHKVADHFERAIDDPKKRPWYFKMLPATLQAAIDALFTKWAMQ